MLHLAQRTNDLAGIAERPIGEIARELVEQAALPVGARERCGADAGVDPVVEHRADLREVEQGNVYEAAEVAREGRVFLDAILEQVVIELLARHEHEHAVLLQEQILEPLDERQHALHLIHLVQLIED